VQLWMRKVAEASAGLQSGSKMIRISGQSTNAQTWGVLKETLVKSDNFNFRGVLQRNDTGVFSSWGKNF
jgi:hypothetical protein